MRWVQSHPSTIPPGRNYVVYGDMERVYADHYNYRPFFESMTEDTILIEWDIAIGLVGRNRFERHAEDKRREIQVAPYRLYPVSTYREDGTIWAHRDSLARSVVTYAQSCLYFGFGLIYFPLEVVRRYVREVPDTEAGSDQSFSHWHQKAFPERRVRIHWDVNVTHLHY